MKNNVSKYFLLLFYVKRSAFKCYKDEWFAHQATSPLKNVESLLHQRHQNKLKSVLEN